MIGTEPGPSVQTATMQVQWCVSQIDSLSTSCQPFTVTLLFVSIDQLDKAEAPFIPEAYIFGVQYLVLLSDGLAGYTFLSTTPSRSKTHPRAYSTL
jgi:hypothetical protein